MWRRADGGVDNWALSLVSAPSIEPITLNEAKAHLRVDFTDDDDYITTLITAARMITEERTNRALITQTWDYIVDDFPQSNYIKIRKPSLQSVENVYYIDSDGNENIMDTSLYVVDTKSSPGRIFLGFAKIWPVVILQPASAVRIQFTAGYGDTPDTIPQPIKQAMLYLISNWYENREPIELERRYAVKIPMTFDLLIGPYKVVRFQ